MTLGNRIQTFRKAAGLSQDALGEHLGVTRQAVSRWEVDAAVPEVDNLIAMGKLFGVTLDELLHGAPERPGPSTGAAANVGAPGKDRAALRRAAHWGSALAAAAVVAALCLLWGRVAALEGQLKRTQEDLRSAETMLTSTRAELAALQQAAAGLDPGAPLVANVEMTCGASGQIGWVKINMTAAQTNDDLKVTFLLSNELGTLRTIQATRQSAVFDTSFGSLANRYGLSITAVFDDGVRQYSRVLIKNLNITANGSASWEPVWLDELRG